MRIGQNLSDLSDNELESLHANAVRLAQSGTPAQRQEAEKLLPLLGAEMEARHATRAAQQTDARRSDAHRKGVVGQSLKGDSNESD